MKATAIRTPSMMTNGWRRWPAGPPKLPNGRSRSAGLSRMRRGPGHVLTGGADRSLRRLEGRTELKAGMPSIQAFGTSPTCYRIPPFCDAPPTAPLYFSFGRYTSLLHLTLARSEEHTSELQSLMRISYAVFCLQKKPYNNKSDDTKN